MAFMIWELRKKSYLTKKVWSPIQEDSKMLMRTSCADVEILVSRIRCNAIRIRCYGYGEDAYDERRINAFGEGSNPAAIEWHLS